MTSEGPTRGYEGPSGDSQGPSTGLEGLSVGAAAVAAGPAGVAAEVLRLLRERGETLAVAESLTGGLVAAEVTAVPGASQAFRGSLTAYATELKRDVLGVDGGLLAARGAVDAEVAAQMATGVRTLLGADWGIATTGVAGPTPQDGQPVGTVFVAVAGPTTVGVRREGALGAVGSGAEVGFEAEACSGAEVRSEAEVCSGAEMGSGAEVGFFTRAGSGTDRGSEVPQSAYGAPESAPRAAGASRAPEAVAGATQAVSGRAHAVADGAGGVSGPGGERSPLRSEGKVAALRLNGNRTEIRMESVRGVLSLLLEQLTGERAGNERAQDTEQNGGT